MTAMNRWIVSKYRFVEHTSFERAQAEKKRLEDLTGKKFHMYRVKNRIDPDHGELHEQEEG